MKQKAELWRYVRTQIKNPKQLKMFWYEILSEQLLYLKANIFPTLDEIASVVKILYPSETTVAFILEPIRNFHSITPFNNSIHSIIINHSMCKQYEEKYNEYLNLLANEEFKMDFVAYCNICTLYETVKKYAEAVINNYRTISNENNRTIRFKSFDNRMHELVLEYATNIRPEESVIVQTNKESE